MDYTRAATAQAQNAQYAKDTPAAPPGALGGIQADIQATTEVLADIFNQARIIGDRIFGMQPEKDTSSLPKGVPCGALAEIVEKIGTLQALVSATRAQIERFSSLA